MLLLLLMLCERRCLLLLLHIRSSHMEILGFLLVVPTNTGIFLRRLKLCGERRTQQVLLVSKMKIGRNHAFFQ